MRNVLILILILISVFLTGCQTTPNVVKEEPKEGGEMDEKKENQIDLFTVIIQPQHKEIRINQPFDVTLSVLNSSNSEQSFLVMNCSWDEHWQSSNPNVSWVGWDCPKNFAITVTLKPGEKYVKTLSMLVLPDVQSKFISFKMGFNPIDSKNVYWSNEIQISIIE